MNAVNEYIAYAFVVYVCSEKRRHALTTNAYCPYTSLTFIRI